MHCIFSDDNRNVGKTREGCGSLNMGLAKALHPAPPPSKGSAGSHPSTNARTLLLFRRQRSADLSTMVVTHARTHARFYYLVGKVLWLWRPASFAGTFSSSVVFTIGMSLCYGVLIHSEGCFLCAFFCRTSVRRKSQQ